MSKKDSLRHLRMQFRQYAVEPEKLFLLKAEKAVELIEKATAEGAALAGVEGFLITTAGAFEPRQDLSNDSAGWQGSSAEFVDATKELIQRGASVGVRFQIVFEDE